MAEQSNEILIENHETCLIGYGHGYKGNFKDTFCH